MTFIVNVFITWKLLVLQGSSWMTEIVLSILKSEKGNNNNEIIILFYWRQKKKNVHNISFKLFVFPACFVL